MTLKEQMQTDVDVFTNPDEHGTSAILSMGGVDKEINIILEFVQDEGLSANTMLPIISLKRTDAPSLDKTALFIIDERRYVVLNIPEDYAIQRFPTILVSEDKS